MTLNSISKNRTEIYGFSILWIMLFHGIVILNLNYARWFFLKPFNFISYYGNMGCEIFLLCSGISLFFAAQKKPEWGSFEKKRVLRLLIPVWLIDGWYWLLIKSIAQGEGILRFITRMSLLDFWITGQQQIWFVSTILLLYFMFPLMYRFIYKNEVELAIVIKTALLFVLAVAGIFCVRKVFPDWYGLVEIGLCRVPVFIIGVYLGHLVFDDRKMHSLGIVLAFIIAFIGLYVLRLNILHGIWRRLFYMIPGIAIMFLVAWFFSCVHLKWLHTVFTFLGKISLNLYLSHILVISIYQLLPMSQSPRIFHYLSIMIFSILFGWAMDHPCRKAMTKLT